METGLADAQGTIPHAYRKLLLSYSQHPRFRHARSLDTFMNSLELGWKRVPAKASSIAAAAASSPILPWVSHPIGSLKSGILGHRGWAYVAVGRACLLLEPFDEARHFGKCSVESLQRQPGSLAHALHLLGDVASHPDAFDAETGAAHYRQALAIAKQHGMRPLIAHCNLGLGQLYGRMGKSEHARENLTAATTMYRDVDMDFCLEQEVR